MRSWWQSAFRSLQGDAEAPPGIVLRGVAAFLAGLYGLGSRSRRALYDRGWLGRQRLPVPVLSIGNLVVGGTGKTPFTAFLARRYQAAGCRVAIVSRGYGGRATGTQLISDGQRLWLRPPQAGDEAYLLAQKLPGIPVVTGADRYQAGMRAWEALQPDLLLLDDGFQHFQLHRDLDVVLLDAGRPFGNGCLLPRGPLREPVSTLKRPLLLVLSRYDSDNARHHQTWRELQEAFPAAVVLRAAFTLGRPQAFPEGRRLTLRALASQKLAALAGLARPERFAADLRQAGLQIDHLFAFPDHHAFTAREVAAIRAAAIRLGIEGLLTTEKDWVRLASQWTPALPLYVVPLEVSLLDDWPDQLLPLPCLKR
ncbi:MAG: tetraacyldisaccharide 4'-kinase [Desulfobacca sp.]|uniref:tetraacyldisaccharide 4'-kinase n=1 Tax=Desulfobacca sp. TaxID=2067990 RepID=UPI00404A2035